MAEFTVTHFPQELLSRLTLLWLDHGMEELHIDGLNKNNDFFKHNTQELLKQTIF